MIKTIVKYNTYRDSVILMGVAEKIQNLQGIKQVVVFMATDTNKTLLSGFGMLSDEVRNASPNDMVIGIETENEQMIQHIINNLETFMIPTLQNSREENIFPTFDMAMEAVPETNLALISVPGEFAAFEAKKAIEKGMNVFIFSDNVPLSEEIELKHLGREKDVLVMGPGCGTGVINQVSLGLMSAVDPGPVGIVGASGSGIQEIAVILAKQGIGISQAIGTGGRDISEEVGGITMIQGIEALDADRDTSLIVLVSKPPAAGTLEKILNVVSGCMKPVIVNFVASDAKLVEKAGAIPAATLEEAALKAVSLLRDEAFSEATMALMREQLQSHANAEKRHFISQQKYLRGLYCGGTHCEEAILILQEFCKEMYSNAPVGTCRLLDDAHSSYRHSLIDLGAEEFTVGRPHPVIDPTILKERLFKEGNDPEVAVILLDIILGYGAHSDPTGFIADTVRSLKDVARQEGRHLCVVAAVCGTEKDSQRLSDQEKTLREAGTIVLSSNAQASILSGLLVA